TMLVGKLPFYSSDLSKLFNTIARCDLPVGELLVTTRDAPPPWLTHLITSLLRRRPSDRPQASEAIDMVPKQIPPPVHCDTLWATMYSLGVDESKEEVTSWIGSGCTTMEKFLRDNDWAL
ncbi:hypothetical protein FOZ62_014111, partial [Perkinsus olseni]